MTTGETAPPPMIYPYYEQLEDVFVVFPTVSICNPECPCGHAGGAWIISIDFLLWSIGIGWCAH